MLIRVCYGMLFDALLDRWHANIVTRKAIGWSQNILDSIRLRPYDMTMGGTGPWNTGWGRQTWDRAKGHRTGPPDIGQA